MTSDYYGQIFEHNGGGTAEQNTATSATVASTLAPYADLISRNLSMVAASDPEATLVSGMTVKVRWDDVNQGNATTGAYRDYVLIDRVNDDDPDHIQILETVASVLVDSAALAPDSAENPLSQHHEVTLQLPDGARGAGRFRVRVFTDYYGEVVEYNANSDAENNQFVSVPQTVGLAAYPDLIVGAISGPATGRANQEILIDYTITNRGNASVTGEWTDWICLSDDAEIGDDQFVGSFTYSATIGAGESLLREDQPITLPAFGAGSRRIVVRTDVGNSVFEYAAPPAPEGDSTESNSSIDDATISLAPTISLVISSDAIVEYFGEHATTATISRSDSTAEALEVTLLSNNTGRVTVVGTATIPAGASSTVIELSAVDNALDDGDTTVTITASATGYDDTTDTVFVYDDDEPMLLVTLSPTSVSEGGSAVTGTVFRNTPTTEALVINLSSSNTDDAAAPATVTIPAGEMSATFSVTLGNNTVIDGIRTRTIVAAATGMNSGSASLTINDDDVPNLTLELNTSSISEGASNPALYATITRDRSFANALGIDLVSSIHDLVRAPFNVVIPAGQASVTVPLNVDDDNLVNGTRLVTISAFSKDFVLGQPIDQGADSATIEVTDNDGPTLIVHVDTDLIGETGSTTATVTRNTLDNPAELVVTLASSDTGEATVPATVTIAANEMTATFTINGVVDGVSDGDQPVTIIASATDFNPGADTLTVTDINRPDLTVAITDAPTRALTRQSGLSMTYRVTNNGLGEATGTWVDRVYLSGNGTIDGNAILLGEFTQSGPLAIGDSYEHTVTFTAPDFPTGYSLVVATDMDNAIREGVETNNQVASATLEVTPSYNATINVDRTVFHAGESIPFTGHAFLVDLDGNPTGLPATGNKPVAVRVTVNGVQRTLPLVFPDENGDFSDTFVPLPGEAGHYEIAAVYPQANETPVQDTFDIVGMRTNPSGLSVEVVPNTPLTGQIRLTNASSVPLTDLMYVVNGAPADMTISFDLPVSLDGNATVDVPFSITATQNTKRQGTVRVTISSAEEASTNVTMNILVAPLTPQFATNPGYFERGLLRGEQVLIPFELANIGGASTGSIEVVFPPEVPWMTLVQGTHLPSLAPGQTTPLMLSLTPPESLDLQAIFQGTGPQ